MDVERLSWLHLYSAITKVKRLSTVLVIGIEKFLLSWVLRRERTLFGVYHTYLREQQAAPGIKKRQVSSSYNKGASSL